MPYYIPLTAKRSARRSMKIRRKHKMGKLPAPTIHISVNKKISHKDARTVANFYARNKNKNTASINRRFLMYGGKKFSRAMYKKFYK